MMCSKCIAKVAETIANGVKERAYCVQIYGSWNNGDEEERRLLAENLRERGVETVKLCDYAELYIPVDMDSKTKEEVISQNKKIAPLLYEKAAVEFHQHRRDMMAMDSFMSGIAHAVAEALMEIMDDDDDDDDDDEFDEADYDEEDDDDEEYDEEYDCDEE